MIRQINRSRLKGAIVLISVFGPGLGVVLGQSNVKTSKRDRRDVKVSRKFINPKGVDKPAAYSHAVSVKGGRTIYISGQIPMNEKGELVGAGDLKKQAEQIFENMKNVLKALGADFSDVVKISYFIKNFDPSMLAIIRDVRGQYYPKDKPLPASSLIGVQTLFRQDVLIEIECIAVVE